MVSTDAYSTIDIIKKLRWMELVYMLSEEKVLKRRQTSPDIPHWLIYCLPLYRDEGGRHAVITNMNERDDAKRCWKIGNAKSSDHRCEYNDLACSSCP